MSVEIHNLTKKRAPKAPFAQIKDKVIGKKYDLSLVFCGDTLSRRLNRVYRGKDKPTNVLSFTLSENSGEIFINLSKLGQFSVLHLFIHGLLHLKGMAHGDKMEFEEEKLLRTGKKLLNGASNYLRS